MIQLLENLFNWSGQVNLGNYQGRYPDERIAAPEKSLKRVETLEIEVRILRCYAEILVESTPDVDRSNLAPGNGESTEYGHSSHRNPLAINHHQRLARRDQS